jgi:hypothetical protein
MTKWTQLAASVLVAVITSGSLGAIVTDSVSLGADYRENNVRFAGTVTVVHNNNFVEIASGISSVGFTNPAESVGDIAGRGFYGGPSPASPGLTWTYDLAFFAAGYDNISYSGFAAILNPSGDDSILYELLVNGQVEDSDTVSLTAQSGVITSNVSLTFAGGASSNTVQVRVTPSGFTAADESFLSSGTLSANAIPEPSALLAIAAFAGVVGTGSWYRRRITN